MMVGFQQVICVGIDVEQSWTRLSTEDEDKLNGVNYAAHTSPNMDLPDQGFLVAEVVRMLARCVCNRLFETANTVRIPPPYEIQVPPVEAVHLFLLSRCELL